jgi:thiosulfate/3-mercaptopyruvate sulfurtransferase
VTGGSDRDSVLVSTHWLTSNLGTAGLRVVDIRGKVMPPGSKPRYFAKRDDYEAGHIPGAVFVDWTRDIVDPLDSVPGQIAGPDRFAEKMSELGIGDDTLVVAYDDYHHIFAGRLAWALQFYGHDAVRILDGGWSRWVSEGRPTSREVPVVTPARFTARPRPSLRKTADDVARALGSNDVVLIDARAQDQYAGVVSAARRAGHIPGARNVHYAKLVDARTGTFRSNEELSQIFADADVDVTGAGQIILYCNGGISCTAPLHALRMLGRTTDIAVYDGSWNEWGNDDARPIAGGKSPTDS